MPKSWSIRITLLGALVVLIALPVLVSTTSSFAPSPDEPPPDTTPAPPPLRLPPEPRPTVDRIQERKKAEQEGRLIITSGPETKGMRIHLADTFVQLPPDAYVAYYVAAIQCVVGEFCPETPVYVLQRGNSRISVSAPTGTMFAERIAPGEEGAFDFLKEVLP